MGMMNEKHKDRITERMAKFGGGGGKHDAQQLKNTKYALGIDHKKATNKGIE
jgi:hypothetical protein